MLKIQKFKDLNKKWKGNKEKNLVKNKKKKYQKLQIKKNNNFNKKLNKHK